MSQKSARAARRLDPATGHIRRTKAALREARYTETQGQLSKLEIEKRELRAEQREARANTWANLNALFSRTRAKAAAK